MKQPKLSNQTRQADSVGNKYERATPHSPNLITFHFLRASLSNAPFSYLFSSCRWPKLLTKTAPKILLYQQASLWLICLARLPPYLCEPNLILLCLITISKQCIRGGIMFVGISCRVVSTTHFAKHQKLSLSHLSLDDRL